MLMVNIRIGCWGYRDKPALVMHQPTQAGGRDIDVKCKPSQRVHRLINITAGRKGAR